MSHACRCTVCGVQYEAQRSTSRYCSTRCRTRASRAGTSRRKAPASGEVVTPLPAASQSPASSLPYSAERLTVEDLEKAGRLNTPLGQAAVILAKRLDDNYRETGSGVAALSRQLEATLRSATAGAQSASDPVQAARDEVAERRRRRSG